MSASGNTILEDYEAFGGGSVPKTNGSLAFDFVCLGFFFLWSSPHPDSRDNWTILLHQDGFYLFPTMISVSFLNSKNK